MSSKDWLRFNDDSRAKSNREKYITKNGGEFINSGRGWEWVASVSKPKPAVVSAKPKPSSSKKKKSRRTKKESE
tara:strand:+ start:911 stop:1132 length:222 start_codon:yes stop_codon:yes gene_type:complete